MSDIADSPPPAAPDASPTALPPPASARPVRSGRYLATIACVLALVSLVFAGVALWSARASQQRLQGLEPELVRRQQQSDALASEASALAKQAQGSALDTAAKAALVEARVSEVVIQRGQLDELIQSLSRSRDESVLADIESALRMAMQQSAIVGSVEPLVAALQQSDERLTRYSEPRLELVRRAIATDLERMRSVGVADVSVLNVRLDEAVRLVDELPLVAQAARGRQERDAGASQAPSASEHPASAVRSSEPAASSVALAASAASAVAAAVPPDSEASGLGWSRIGGTLGQGFGVVWGELRSLLRVSRIDHPEAMLMAPEEGFFLRENLKLRLLNARLAILSRQFDSAQADLQAVQAALERYFDGRARKVATVADLLRQVSLQARDTKLPRPDETLSALAAAGTPR